LGTYKLDCKVGKGYAMVKEADLNPVPISSREAGSSAAHGKTVLVVEDRREVAILLTRILEAEGHQVDTASDGEAAVEMLERREYDLIISDLKMPGMSGEQLYSRLQKAHPPLAKRVLFITGDIANADTRAFLEKIDKPYLSKPFFMDDVIAAVQRVLTGSGGKVRE
jgi:CheY-like chemotaxis protein